MAHQSRKSDHNPDAGGVVRAVDITNDPSGGLAAEALAESLRSSRDARIKYVIWNRRMFSSYSNATRSAWQWGPSPSSNPHTHHVHISILPDAAAESDTRSWAVGGSQGGAVSPPTADQEPTPDYRNGEYGHQSLDVNKRKLRRDSSNAGGNVGYLQAVLKNEAGEQLDISGQGYGRFGPQTEQAVKNVQARSGVTADGIVGWDGPDGRSPGSNATWPIIDKLARERRHGKPSVPTKKPAADTKPKTDVVAGQGAATAAAAAFRAGFRGDDLAMITMIAGRESGWKSDAVNPKTSDRGMWQINWDTIKKAPYDSLRERLAITTDKDLLDLEKNAAVAWQMYQDSIEQGRPWLPWRASDTGWKNAGPGWDGNGDHRWHTEKFAAEARAAANAVLETGPPATDTTATTPEPDPSTSTVATRGTYLVTDHDSDGFIAMVCRCVGLTDAPGTLRRSAAEAVARHNEAALDKVWHPGDGVRFPPTIDGVRSYRVKSGDGPIAIATGLGLGRDDAAQQRVAAINAWQGTTPHPDDTWYGGAL